MILVTGATGSIGRHLVRRLRQERVPFKAFVRDEHKGRALGCDYVVGDFDDPDSLATALEGVDRLFLNTAGAEPVAGEQPMIRRQKTAIDAAARAGVSKIVKVSVWHAREGALLAEGAHWHIEQHLKASGVDWSVLQPSGFMQNFVTGTGAFTEDGDLVGTSGDARVSYIDCHDIAACAAVLLTGPRGGGESFVLTGPEALTHAEIAEKLSAALGRTVRYVDVPPARMAATLKTQGLPPRFVDDVVQLWQEVAAGSLSATTAAVDDLTGRPARTFEEFLAGNRETLLTGPLARR
ncbi:SDR family oxidoreductase [Sphaerisporangium fuscum]|uniref:SDR family oxidoreductase n=1 Tax=Sphaerisporangium fuscum TaxID=2835868 RepID=UPI001BDC0EFC|nr:SDR family oxidoreductase [Sphaerisporangium fuscum]